MSAFKTAVTNTIEYGLTENAGLTLKSSTSKNVDLFFLIGSGSKTGTIDPVLFTKAYGENPELATRILLWSRDIRGGAGRRDNFRQILKFMEVNYSDDLVKIIPFVPEYGTWKDLLIFQSNKINKIVYDFIWAALLSGNGLTAKWMPRKGPIAVALRNHFGLNPKAYRKLLVSLTNVVETKMCAKTWEEIDFSKIPSLASARYAKAFSRNAYDHYSKYLEALKKKDSKVKVNAGAVFPHDVLKTLKQGNHVADLVRAQWDALPNYLDNDSTILPMVDCSGSMYSQIHGQTLQCIDVAVSIGLYLADKQTGAFKDCLMTFSGKPTIEVLPGDVITKSTNLNRINWGYDTNIELAFATLLSFAKKNKLKDADLPKYILILSDMEFNNSSIRGTSVTSFEKMKELYWESGYTRPNIVFWNIAGRGGNIPVSKHETGTALVSGYSPSICKSIIGAKTLNSEDVMLSTVMVDRYNIWK